MKKKICGLLVAALLLPCLLVGCGSMAGNDDGRLTVVTTTFAAYDWVRNLLGEQEDVAVILLPDNGVDMHSYQFTANDVITLTSCDLLVHVGGADDAMIKEALKNAKQPPLTVNLMETLGNGLKQEEIKDGMEHDHDHASDSCEDLAHGQGTVTFDNADEHVWLSLKNASVFCRAIADKLVEIDPENAGVYERNLETYLASLAALDAAYQATVGTASRRTLLFADRFPFRYLVDDYGLDYYAAFAGCSADTSASFDTVIRLARQIDELTLPCVFVIEDSPINIAASIIQHTATKDQAVLTLDDMQAVTATEAVELSYLGVMQKNLDALASALN